MDRLLELLQNRNSCRAFQEKNIEYEDIEYIVDAALTTASGGDLQAYSIIEIRDSKTKAALKTYSRGQGFIEKAPVLMVLCIDYNRIHQMKSVTPFPEIYLEDHFNMWMSIFDVGLLSQNLTLAAENIGIKSICIGNFFNYLNEVSDLLRLPKHVVPCMLMCFGYPKSKQVQPTKYKACHVLHKEHYKQYSIDEIKQSFNEKYGDFAVKLNEKSLRQFKENAIRYEDQSAIQLSSSLRIGDHLNFYQFWLGAFFDELTEGMTYKDYKTYLNKQGFKWLEE